ncbi:MAG: hypothetical protein FD162_1583 [Rhodobacteraceae bacterium]|uniref:hypothetical protein n=1 Tax=Cypionkella sp. TaxID=2811411 RepID=UPI0013211C69|nr:hypothetical protein [Cypionkella sp.]KAF0173606.1 MAG: hypothetical protein FD162_1583 [Paracoccaceae bacterium]MDO8328250.1 hypothetical protein [Cypionkella sp.]
MKRLAVLLTLTPTLALAHPGDHRFANLVHLVSEPDHLAMIALGVALVVYTAYKLRSRP